MSCDHFNYYYDKGKPHHCCVTYFKMFEIHCNGQIYFQIYWPVSHGCHPSNNSEHRVPGPGADTDPGSGRGEPVVLPAGPDSSPAPHHGLQHRRQHGVQHPQRAQDGTCLPDSHQRGQLQTHLGPTKNAPQVCVRTMKVIITDNSDCVTAA